MSKKFLLARRGCIGWGITGAVIVLLSGAAGLTLCMRPDLAARGADALRVVAGDETVANLEMVLFQAQDAIQKIKYSFGIATPAAPWQTESLIPVTGAAEVAGAPTPRPSLPSDGVLAQTSSKKSVPLNLGTIQNTAPAVTNTAVPQPAWPSQATQPAISLTASPTPTQTDVPTPSIWQPTPLTPMGSLAGEGVWKPYLADSLGSTLAYRTFLQPDPNRPFVLVAVIGFDLKHTRLHFVLGSQEPFSPDAPKRSGKMPEADQAPGRLLAMFNGGFKATHGHFGAMADGVTALPPRDGIGTLVMYQDGRVRMGTWGSTIYPAPDMEAWRQNGPLVVADGAINARIYNNSPKDWGYTVNDVSPTWRSGIGLSADSAVLYYFVGPSLTMEYLARSMIAAGAYQGMQLDINNYWVHFVAVQDCNGNRTLEPLFPDIMKEHVGRYLGAYSRDFFYVTTVE